MTASRVKDLGGPKKGVPNSLGLFITEVGWAKFPTSFDNDLHAGEGNGGGRVPGSGGPRGRAPSITPNCFLYKGQDALHLPPKCFFFLDFCKRSKKFTC